MKKTGILFGNTLSSFATQGILALAAFISIPYLVNSLGPEQYGLLSLGLAVAGYVGVVELGIGRAVTRYVAAYYAMGNHEKVGRVISSGLTISLITSAFVVIILCASSPLLASKIFHLQGDLRRKAILVFSAVAFATGLNVLNLLFRGIIMGLQEIVLLNKNQVFFGLIKAGLGIFIVYLGGQVTEISYGLVGITLAETIVLCYITTLKLPEALKIDLRLAIPDVKPLVDYGLSLSVSSTLASIATQLDKVLLGFYLPISAVGYVAVAMEAAGKVWVLPGILLTPLYPMFSALSATKDKESLDMLFASSLKILLGLILFPVLFLLVYPRILLTYWINPEYANQVAFTMMLLTLGIAFSCIIMFAQTFLNAIGFPKVSTYGALIFLLAHGSLSIVLIPLYGINGLAFSWVITHFLYLLGIFYFTLKKGRFTFWLNCLISGGVRFGLLCVVWFVLLTLLYPFLLNLASIVFTGLVLWPPFLLSCYLLLLNRGEQKKIKHVVQDVPPLSWLLAGRISSKMRNSLRKFGSSGK